MIFDTIYQYAWFVGLPLAAVVYVMIMWGRAKPAELIELEPQSAGDSLP